MQEAEGEKDDDDKSVFSTITIMMMYLFTHISHLSILGKCTYIYIVHKWLLQKEDADPVCVCAFGLGF